MFPKRRWSPRALGAPSVMRLPSPVLVCQAYEITEHFLRTFATPFFTCTNGSPEPEIMAAGAGRVGVSAAARALYAAGMSSTDEPAAAGRRSRRGGATSLPIDRNDSRSDDCCPPTSRTSASPGALLRASAIALGCLLLLRCCAGKDRSTKLVALPKIAYWLLCNIQ